jgi:hypothetical protein
MDRRSNPLGSEERGVIFAGHERGRSQRAIASTWVAKPEVHAEVRVTS